MIIVLDTSVVVSGILKPYGKAAAILRSVVSGLFTPAYDQRILAEYGEVLNRPKFDFSDESVRDFLALIEVEGVLVPAIPLSFSLPDPDDEPFLEIALSSQAVALITGNKRHFPKKTYGKTKIISPAEFLELFGNSLLF
jgi:putative PIN family toxin of toxin-antitoxin system